MNARSMRFARGAVGAVVLIILALVVRGWWGEYRDAVDRAPVAETTATASPDATTSPGAEEGEEPAKKPAGSTKLGTVTVLIDGLNFRESPQADAKPIRGLRKGEKLTALSERAGWYEVRSADGGKGWVSSNPNYTQLEK